MCANDDAGACFCPECGGVFFAGTSLVYEHSNLSCSMRWDQQERKWKPTEDRYSGPMGIFEDYEGCDSGVNTTPA